MRNSSNYGYTVWLFKVFSIKKLLHSKIIRKENNRQSFGNGHKTHGKPGNKQRTPFHHTNLTHQRSFKNINLRIDHHTRGKWFIQSLKHRKENLLSGLEHPLLIILSSVYEYDMKDVQGNLSNPFFEKTVSWWKYSMRINAERVSHTLIISYQVNIVTIWYRITRGPERLGPQKPSLLPSVRHLYMIHTHPSHSVLSNSLKCVDQLSLLFWFI